jgi:hypothetical protein
MNRPVDPSRLAAFPDGAAALMRDITHALARVTVFRRAYPGRDGAPRGAAL